MLLALPPVFLSMLPFTKRLLCHFQRYWISGSSLWLRQEHGWMELRLDQIAALKPKTVSRIIVRYYDSQRFTISLFGFSNPAYDAVCRSLRDAMRQNEQTRGLWNGTTVLKHYD